MSQLIQAEKRREAAARPPVQTWPSPQDYNEAIQNPSYCFDDDDLRLAESELTVLGFPKPVSGNFASVYHLINGNSDWAVRCFLQPLADHEQRYEAISAKFAEVNAPFLTGFRFISRGIRVGGQWYPILKMEWVKGQMLLEYIEQHLHEPKVLLALADSFKKIVPTMQSHGIAHGDLQHGNIMVEANGQIRLVDFDGCYVLNLDGKASNELGHRNYQHPLRMAQDFCASMDNYSSWLIWISIVATTEDPLLWNKLEAGDECMLFRQKDMLRPQYSRAFHVLELHQNESIRKTVRFFRSLIGLKVSQIPPLSEEISEPKNLPLLDSILSSTTASDTLQTRKTSSRSQNNDSNSSWHTTGKIGGVPIALFRMGSPYKTHPLMSFLIWSSSSPFAARYLLSALVLVVFLMLVFSFPTKIPTDCRVDQARSTKKE